MTARGVYELIFSPQLPWGWLPMLRHSPPQLLLFILQHCPTFQVRSIIVLLLLLLLFSCCCCCFGSLIQKENRPPPPAGAFHHFDWAESGQTTNTARGALTFFRPNREDNWIAQNKGCITNTSGQNPTRPQVYFSSSELIQPKFWAGLFRSVCW